MANCIMCGKTVDNYPGYVTDGVISVCNDCASSNSLMRVMTRIGNSNITANLKSVFSPLIEVGLVDQTDERVELDKDKLDAKRGSNYFSKIPLEVAIHHIYDECERIWNHSHDKDEVHSKFTERMKELEEFTGKSADKLGIYEPNFENSDKPQGYHSDCPFLPCENCHFYYGEIDSCMVGEEGVVPTEEELNKVREALGEEAARDFFAPGKPVGILGDIENMPLEDFYSKYADNPDALNMWHDYHGEPSDFIEV